MSQPSLHIRQLGMQDYEPVWRQMQDFTASRDDNTPDEVWLVEHPPVYTQGLNGKDFHVLDPGDIPVVPIDRGGQVTYHGPGQQVAYVLLDINRLGIGVQALVQKMEQAVINLLADYDIEAQGRRDAPGVYVGDAKIAALGLRVKKGRTYHGLSFNIDMDLEPFSCINPCGYAGMAVTQLSDLAQNVNREQVARQLVEHLSQVLGYNSHWLDI